MFVERFRIFIPLLLILVAALIFQASRMMVAEERTGNSERDTREIKGNLTPSSIPYNSDRTAEDYTDKTVNEQILDIREAINTSSGASPIFQMPTSSSQLRSSESDDEHAAFIEALQIARREIGLYTQTSHDLYPPATDPRRPAADRNFLEMLFTASRQIDDKVHQLDVEGDYNNADRLRQLANQLRTEARRF